MTPFSHHLVWRICLSPTVDNSVNARVFVPPNKVINDPSVISGMSALCESNQTDCSLPWLAR
jgi:hypothetical protein